MAFVASEQEGAQIKSVTMAHRLKSIFIGSIGNLIEWYDFYAYAAFSLYFAGSFFPKGDPVAEQLNAAFVFAFGFIVRPVGGWLFGVMADRRGRKSALTLSVLLMCLGSLMIALAPPYAAVGPFATFVLIFARLLQGLSLGGEYGTSATYLSEMADAKNRGFYSSFQYVTLIGGQLVAIVFLFLLQQFLSEGELKQWGWRVPFFIGALLAVIGYYMRAGLDETTQFARAKEAQGLARDRRGSSLAALLKHPKEVLLVIGLTLGGTTAFYTYTTTMQKILLNNLGMKPEITTQVVFVSLLFAVVLQPLYGALSDRIGRRPLLLFFGIAGTLFTVPLLHTLQALPKADSSTPWYACLLICLGWIIVAGYTSINAIVKAELFPTSIRALGVGLPYALTVAIFGGTADSVALTFKDMGHPEYYEWYLTACIFVSLLVYVFMRDTKARSAMDKAA